MNIRVLLTATFAVLVGGACSTSTPIGVVDTAGTSGGQPTGAAGTTGVAGTMGAIAGTVGAIAGTTGAAGTVGGTAGTTGQYVPSAGQVLNDQPFTNPSGISGDWVGYLENYNQYFEGSDAIRLHFGVDAQGNNTITVVQGTGAPPSPPTDAFQAWPAPAFDDQGNPGSGISYPGMPIAGFAYTAHEVTWSGARLKFEQIAAEPWASWCALQMSYLLPNTAPDTWSCNAGNEVGITGPGTCKFLDGPAGSRCTLNHQFMCNPNKICGCNDTGCGASTSSRSSFDITFFEDHAVGSMENYNLMLTPATP